jgi:hypothetical protein
MNSDEKMPANLAQGKPLMDSPSMISVMALIQHLGESIHETGVLSSRLEDRVCGILGPRKKGGPEVAEPCVGIQHLNEHLLMLISDLNKINNNISINVLRMEEGIGY